MYSQVLNNQSDISNPSAQNSLHQSWHIDVNYFIRMDERYHFDYLVLDYTRDNHLIKHFDYLQKNRNEWAVIYFNEKSIIYAKREPQFKNIIKEDEYHCLHPVLTFNKEKFKAKQIDCLLHETLRSLSENNQIQNTRILWQSISLNLKRYDDALKEAEKLMQIWPNDYRTLTFMGQLYFLKEDKKQARIMLNKALSINPKYKKAKDFLGRLPVD